MRPSNPLRRREILGTISLSGAALLSGCSEIDGSSSNSGTRYTLSVSDEGGWDHMWVPKHPSWAEHERGLVEKMVQGEMIKTVGYVLTNLHQWAESYEPVPNFVERDGEFYKFEIDTIEQTTVDRWLLWFKEIEGEPPADATVISEPPADLSEQDQTAVRTAISRSTGTPRNGKDIEDAPPEVRGFLFFEHDPQESELVPELPFTHLKKSDDEMHYYEAISKRVTVTAPAYTYCLSPVATSEADLESYIDENIYDIKLSSAELTDSETSHLETAIDEYIYKENGEISESFEGLLEKLEYPTLDTDERIVFYDGQYFEYDGTRYSGSLSIKVPDNPTQTSAEDRS